MKLLQSVPKTPVYESRGMFWCEFFLKKLLYVFYFWISSEKRTSSENYFGGGAEAAFFASLADLEEKINIKNSSILDFEQRRRFLSKSFVASAEKPSARLAQPHFFSRSKLWRKRVYDENAKALSHFKTPRSKRLLQFCLKIFMLIVQTAFHKSILKNLKKKNFGENNLPFMDFTGKIFIFLTKRISAL